MTLFAVDDLAVSFAAEGGRVRAVDGISWELAEGEVLGLVGESGSGKSVSSLAVLGLLPTPPGRIDGGRWRLRGEELSTASARRLRALRGRELAMIFQDPMTALNPLLTVGLQLAEVLEVHERLARREALRRAARALGEVGIPAPEERLARYPHELSGGMRQRVMIAMALLCRPAVLFADEPTTALDVTIQAQVLELLGELRRRHGTAIVLVSHDLGVIAGMADRVLVMYAGRIVERAGCEALFARPVHPYTAGLLASVPTLSSDPARPLATIPGQPPDQAALPPGCAFAPRCALAVGACRVRRPELLVVPGAAHERAVACPESPLLAGGAAR